MDLCDVEKEKRKEKKKEEKKKETCFISSSVTVVKSSICKQSEAAQIKQQLPFHIAACLKLK